MAERKQVDWEGLKETTPQGCFSLRELASEVWRVTSSEKESEQRRMEEI